MFDIGVDAYILYMRIKWNVLGKVIQDIEGFFSRKINWGINDQTPKEKINRSFTFNNSRPPHWDSEVEVKNVHTTYF